ELAHPLVHVVHLEHEQRAVALAVQLDDRLHLVPDEDRDGAVAGGEARVRLALLTPRRLEPELVVVEAERLGRVVDEHPYLGELHSPSPIRPTTSTSRHE